MAVFKIQKTQNFTVVANHCFKNRNISMRARGLLCFMLSLPEDWDFSEAGLVACTKEGKNAIRSALKELEEEGYLVRKRVRDEKGRIVDMEYNIYEVPPVESVENTCVEPKADFPTVDYPKVENQPQKNKEMINKKINKLKNNNLSVFEIEAGIKEQIEYDWLSERSDIDKGLLENVLSCIVTMKSISLVQKTMRIGDTIYSSELLENKLSALTSQHIEYILECFKYHTGKIRNIKAYLQASIINSIDTMDMYYTSEAKHDMKYGNIQIRSN